MGTQQEAKGLKSIPLNELSLICLWNFGLGGEITHQHQSYETNERKEHAPKLSLRAVKRLSLVVAAFVANRFLRGEKPPTLEETGRTLEIPSRALSDILARLVAAGIMSEVIRTDPEDSVYQPARDPHLLTPADILAALDNLGEDLEAGDTGAYADLLKDFEKSARSHPKNRTLG